MSIPTISCTKTYIDKDDYLTYHFSLAGFALARDAANAHTIADDRTVAKSLPFVAPDVVTVTKRNQSPKVEIWSLFATIVWLWDIEGIPQTGLGTQPR